MSMYIEKLDEEERAVVSDAVMDVINKVERAHDLIQVIFELNFEWADGRELLAKEEVGSILYTTRDLLFDALLEYNLTIGNGEFGGVKPFISSIEAIKCAIS